MAMLEALVLTEEQLRALSAKDDEDVPVTDLRIVSTTKTGFVRDALAERAAEPLSPRRKRGARSLTCANEAIPE